MLIIVVVVVVPAMLLHVTYSDTKEGAFMTIPGSALVIVAVVCICVFTVLRWTKCTFLYLLHGNTHVIGAFMTIPGLALATVAVVLSYKSTN